MAVSDYSRTIPQRLRATFTPPAGDARFDDVLARLTRSLDGAAQDAWTSCTTAPATPCESALTSTDEAKAVA